MAGARRAAPAAGRSLPVGSGGGAVLRLQRRNRAAPPLSVRDDFLSAVGGHVVAPAGATGRRQSGALRSARRHPDEHRDQWSNEVGFGWTNAAVVVLAGLERRRAVASAAERQAVTGWKELSVRPHDHDGQRRAR